MGVYFSISAFFILIIFAINFFARQRIHNNETESYKYLIIVTIIGLFFEIITCLLYKLDFNIDSSFYKFISKLVFCYYNVWSYLFASYIISVCDGNSKTKKFILLLTISSIICVLISPIYFNKFQDVILPYGESLYATYLVAITFTFIDIYHCIRYRKKIMSKKFLPLYFFLGLAIVNIIINFMYSNLFLLGFILAYDVMIMYFTIENPDVKLIQELEIAKNEADKANNAKTDFLSSMSHEIRTPLNAIVGFSECIEKANDLKEAKEDAKDIVMASNNLLEIVNGILDINKIEANKMEIVNSEYALYEILDNLVKMARVRIGEKNIELKTSFSKKLPDVLYGDAGKLKQIITNILTNAIKYTEEGYIEFNCDCTIKDNNCNLVISIKDTGRGIKRENIKGLFNKFERLEEDKNTNIEGTGLGLAITKKLLDMMGGKIEVESVYGKGSTFTVYLKQKIGKKKVKKEEDILENVTFDNNKILVVDDNLLNLRVIEKLLREYKVELDLVDSGYKCLEQVKKKKYDLIFLDIMMPKMNGIETLKYLKDDKDFKIPVVALTADAIDKADKKYLEEGFNDYLSKPIDSHALLKVLAKYLKYEKKVIKKKKEVLKNTDYLKKEKIDVDASLALLGDIKMYEEMLKTFLEESKKRILRLKKNKDNDLENYKIDVHAMKSDSKYLGFKKLAELSLDHEMNAKDNNQDYINQHFDELMMEFERIKKVIEKYLEDRK